MSNVYSVLMLLPRRADRLRSQLSAAKYVITDGLVKVNGEVDERRGRKVYEGDVVSYDGKEIKVIR